MTPVETLPAVARPLRRKLMHGLVAALLHEGVSVVLCTTCAAEASAVPEDEAEDFEAGA